MARCFLLALPESLKWSGIHKSHKSYVFTKSASARVVASNARRAGKASFSMACCLCGKKSFNDKILHSSSLKSNLFYQQGSEEINVKESVPRHQSWSQDGRQLLDSIKRRWPWTEKEALAEEAFSRAPKWRKLLRMLKAETRKVSCITRPPGFNYDPHSYAMNFDEGCWKSDMHGEGYLHSMRITEDMPLKKSSSLSHPSTLSLWQRRKTSKPLALDLEKLPTWRSTRLKL